MKKNWKKELAEYAFLHSEDCCVHTKYGCDAGIGELECCDTMQILEHFISLQIKRVIKFISHDMKFTDEEQRKAVVKMYIEHFSKNK